MAGRVDAAPAPETWHGKLATEEFNMRGILLWVVGIPIPIIILLYHFHLI